MYRTTPLPACGDLGHRLMKLRAAIAQHAAEDVAGQTLAVDAHQDRLGLHRNDAVDLDADAAHAQGQVRLRIDHARCTGSNRTSPYLVGSFTDQLAVDQRSRCRRYLISSSMVHILSSCCWQNSRRSGRRAMRPIGMDDSRR